MITLRNAVIEDAARLLEIYSYYVENTAITFVYGTPSLDEFQERMRRMMKRYPYLVILRNGCIEGYAYANTFIDRAAYDWSCETTIYLDPSARKCGMGRMLYQALEGTLKKMGVLNLYACIAYPEIDDEYLTINSTDFHEHFGFRKAGEFHQCSYKFGRWYHMIWMEKLIGSHEEKQPPVSLP